MNDAMRELVAGSYPAYNLRGRLTFAGAIRKYWEKVSLKWIADRTVTENIADYERRILQEIDPFMAISEMTKCDIERLINRLSTVGDYAEGTENHYRHLIALVINACIEGGEDMNISLAEYEVSHDDMSTFKTELIKSLSETEERLMYRWVKTLAPETVTGPEIAVAYMFAIGLRNQECAGLHFGNHYYSKVYDCNMVQIIQTVIGKSRATKLRGKTVNAQRVIPCISEVLNDLVYSRAEFVRQQLNISSVKTLPVCCMPGNYEKHCTYAEVNDAAKTVFSLLGISGNTWASLMAAFDPEDQTDIDDVIAEEKDPTAYMLRRNAATRYYGLNLSEQELQYVMGHEIENTNLKRKDFQNYEVMISIVTKLKEGGIKNWKEKV